MTEETQALVDRLRKRAREEPSNGQGGGKMLEDAAAALTSLSRDLEAARQERDAALADVAEMEALFCGIKEIHATPGWASAIVDGEGVKWFAGLVSQFFYQAGGKNYVEWQCSVDVAEFVLTCQRKAGKTPDQLRREAEASRDAAVRAARAETWAEAARISVECSKANGNDTKSGRVLQFVADTFSGKALRATREGQ